MIHIDDSRPHTLLLLFQEEQYGKGSTVHKVCSLLNFILQNAQYSCETFNSHHKLKIFYAQVSWCAVIGNVWPFFSPQSGLLSNKYWIHFYYKCHMGFVCSFKWMPSCTQLRIVSDCLELCKKLGKNHCLVTQCIFSCRSEPYGLISSYAWDLFLYLHRIGKIILCIIYRNSIYNINT